MKDFHDHSIDLALCDPPYSITAHKWDSLIPLDEMWKAYRRILKPDGIVCLFGTQPFTTKLISSNYGWWRYNWIWVKDSPTGFLNSAYAPLKITEDICVFSPATVGSLSKNPIRYYPQGAVEICKAKRNRPNSRFRATWGYSVGGNALNSDKPYTQRKTNLPNNLLFFARDRQTVHPTQKPVALLAYLIKTYTNGGAVVLDNCMGSGSTGVACLETGRSFIGIEKDFRFFEIAKKRIEESKGKSGLNGRNE